MGKLGWTEYEYYTSSPYMFFAACEGYFDKEEDLKLLVRRLAAVVHRSMGGKMNEKEYWPLISDTKKAKTQDKKVWGEDAKELRERIMKAHNIKLV